MLLAECMRQAAWQELYSQQAVRLEEHLGKLRGKEAARRAHFLQQVGTGPGEPGKERCMTWFGQWFKAPVTRSLHLPFRTSFPSYACF